MYNKAQLAAHGVTIEKIKALAESYDTMAADDKFKKWIDREASRIQDGVDKNLKNWRLYWALDQAYDAPFHQISYTLLKDIMSKDYDDDRVNSMIEDFGVGHLLEPIYNTEGKLETNDDGTQRKALNVPVFLEIFVPLCAAYLKARWSKLFNDRNLTPLYKYEPAYSTQENRVRCDIITSRISVMANQYGYANDEKDSIFQALHYGTSIAFPRESWHRDYQLDSEGKKKVVREGLRFNMPPPERTYIDQSERAATINYNSGVAYAGYWHIAKYGDVVTEEWWNTDKISYGNDLNIIQANPNFFSNIYPCTLRFPDFVKNSEENDRESEYAAYASDDYDKAVLRCEHFTTVVPKDVGVGTYEYPVTFRMVMTNYNTISYIEPMFCQIGAYYGYDSDGNRAKNSSLTLEIMPFQDQIGNILTQWIASAKQNLTTAVFYDESIVPKEAVDAMKNSGEKLIKSTAFIGFNSADMRAKLGEVREAFHSPQIPRVQTGEMQTLIRGLLDLLERALQFSPQEIGQAASHEQSATESTIINNNIGNRVQFTGTFIDEGIWAKKKILYDSLMANSDDDIMAEVYPNYTETYAEFEKLCKDLGIEIIDRAGNNGEKAKVKVPAGKKDALLIEAFVSNRDATNRVNDSSTASAAVQLLQSFASNPELFAAVGAEQIVELTNQIASLFHLPKDFRLRYNAASAAEAKNGGQSPEIMNQVQQGMKQMAEEIAKRIEQGEKSAMEAIQAGDQKVAEGVASEVAPVLKQQGEAIQKLAEGQQQLGEEVQQIGQAVGQIVQGIQQAQQQQPQA